MREKDQIGLREMFSLLAITIGLKGTDITASVIIGSSINAAWIVIVGSFICICPSLFILNKILKKQQSKTLLDIIRIGFGKYLSFAFLFMFFIYLLINVSTDSRSYVDQLLTMNLPKTPLFALFSLFLFVCMWCAKKGWESLGYLAWMIYPYVIIACGLLFFLLAKEESPMRIFPLIGPGLPTLAKQSFHFGSTFAELFAVSMMYPYIKDHKTYTKGIVISSAYCVALVVLFHISYTLAFDFRSADKITYPFSEATRLVSVGTVITNVETFFLTFWAVCVVIKFAVSIYFLSKLFGFLFQIEEFEHLIFPLTILILIVGMIPENEIYNIFEVRNFMFYLGTSIYILLPLSLWTVLKVKEVLNK
ncbi:GerAB/ArcD/ProY family transporter [Bacillus sp. USDA818B3_A]|uniref:GerAB/ArcD/ProY family transporter n=1 Tax=Bacillus sp. USDA818B3_A TaxID=2698834 RepID=UPI00136A83A1|nr:endospore germination permease [Bacillus sp. USDA818B3_A]